MTFRAKFFILFSLAVSAGAALFAWGATGIARQELGRLDRGRSDTLAAQFQQELVQRGEEVSNDMQGLADAEGTLRMALDLSRPEADASVYASDARGLATAHQLDLLDLVAADGTLISSAQWPARSGYKNDWVTGENDWNQRGAFLQRVELPDGGVELGLLAVRVLHVGQSNLYLIGGQRFDPGFLRTLTLPSGFRALLYRNLEDSFTPADLASADGPVEQPERFASLIESAKKSQDRAQQTIQWTADPASAESFVALPLSGRDNQALVVILLGSSQRELAALANSIRVAALLFAALGILCGLFLSAWVSARVTRPLRRLTAGMREVAAGNWAARVKVGPRDEAGQLARAFNQMTACLSEERLRLLQAERVAAWRDVAQGMAYEVKQSLFPLEIAASDLSRAREDSSDRVKEILSESMIVLRSELDNLKAALTRFSDFVRMPRPRSKPVDVNDLLHEVLNAFEPRFRAVGRPPITPELYLSNRLGKIQADTDLLRRALENLFLHAIDIMPGGGSLTVRTEQVNKIVRIEVSGSGVEPESPKGSRMFCAFRTRHAPGVGLGLPTTQAVVSDHGGKFSAESAPGAGTIFRIEFAVTADVATTAPALPAAPAAADPRRPEAKREMPEIPQAEQVAVPVEVATPVASPVKDE